MVELHDFEIAEKTEATIRWMSNNLAWFFDPLNDTFQGLVNGIQDILLGPPVAVLWAIIVIIGLLAGGWRLGLFTLLGWGLIISMDLWDETLVTLSLVLAAGAVITIFGLPLGIAMARSAIVKQITRPVLDFMQTMPAFVYLIPALFFFDLGAPAGLLATALFAFPPLVRLVAHGIEQVDSELVEASDSFGANGWQTLFKVQVPLAIPSIMVGMNQMLMLSLSMAVIASMVAFKGLGAVVLTGLATISPGIGFEGGLGIVILAITVDRVTQALGHADYSQGGFFQSMVNSAKRAVSGMNPFGRSGEVPER